MGNAKTEREKRRRARKRGEVYKPPAPKMKAAPVRRPGYGEPNWSGSCENCGQSPTVEPVGLCGPCCFGEAATAGGNW